MSLSLIPGLGLQLHLEEKPEDLPSRLAAVHADLLLAGKHSRSAAEKFYNRAVAECSYAIGDRVLIFHPPGLVETGRKLRVPWIGPYRIVESQSDVSYVLRSEIEGKSARVHVNRLRKIAGDEDLAETGDPLTGMWPDSRRILSAVLETRAIGDRVEYKIVRQGRRGYGLVPAAALPDVVKTAFAMSKKERGGS
jgi:hypothetical protein